jgi:hypothetical protein
VAIAAVLAGAVGGCDVQKVDRKLKSDTVREIERTNTAAFDLRTPLTREAAGFADGRSGMMIGHTGGKPPIEATLTLPEDGTLSATVTGIAVLIPTEAPETRLPANLVLNEEAESLEAARDRLLAEAPALGLDEARIEEWFAAATAMRGSTELDDVAALFIRGRQRGYLNVGVEARYNPPAGPPLLNWQVDWRTGS